MSDDKEIPDVFLREELMVVEEAKEGENILATLSPKKASQWDEVLSLNAKGVELTQEFLRLQNKLQRLRQRFEARRFIFWDEVESTDERFESVMHRGKTLAIRRDPENSGKYVVVEFDLPQGPMGVFVMPYTPDDQE